MIKELIYDFFDDVRKEKETEKIEFRTHISPSYLMKCARQIIYKKRNIPASNPIDSHTYIKFAMGDAVHEKLTAIFKKMGLKIIESENLKTKKWLDMDWVYIADDVIEKNNEKYIVEKKSVYFSGYNGIKTEPKIEHVIQLYCYMELEKINRGILLYIGRDNGHIVEYCYSVEQLRRKIGEKVKAYVSSLKKIIELSKNCNYLPNRGNQIVIKNNNGYLTEKFQKNGVQYKSDWQCNYCQWKNLCWADVYEKIKDYTFFKEGKFE